METLIQHKYKLTNLNETMEEINNTAMNVSSTNNWLSDLVRKLKVKFSLLI